MTKQALEIDRYGDESDLKIALLPAAIAQAVASGEFCKGAFNSGVGVHLTAEVGRLLLAQSGDAHRVAGVESGAGGGIRVGAWRAMPLWC